MVGFGFMMKIYSNAQLPSGFYRAPKSRQRDGIKDQFLIFIFIVVPLPVGIGITVRPVTLSKGLFYSRGHKILGKELVVL